MPYSFFTLKSDRLFITLLLGLRELVAQPSPGENCKRTSEKSPSRKGGETKAKPALTLHREKIFWMHHSAETGLSMGAAVGSGCKVCGTSIGGCGSPGGGRNAGNDKPGGGGMRHDGDSSRGDEDALVLIVSERLVKSNSANRKTPPPVAICGRAGKLHEAGHCACPGDDEALVLNMVSLSKCMRCHSEACCNPCAERVAIDVLTAGDAVAMLSGSMRVSASGTYAGIPAPRLPAAIKEAMSKRHKSSRPGTRAEC
mmetsp:Transcript_13358/g.33715  ORF Transcript_13358/g.33715 Transcript_13358/m.33715 type:complete len:256 (+) Transcript_13358:352-1119(+)